MRFEDILTDNGAEFAARTNPTEHPFEAMLLELGIRHRYTRPYRTQTNGKAERFWRTRDDDLIDGTSFDDIVCHTDFRPHQAIGGKTPRAFADETKLKPKSTKS